MTCKSSIAAILSIFLWMPALASESVPELEAAGNEDPQVWYTAAKTAREAGDTDMARRALDRAAELGLSPVRVGVERARLRVVDGDRAGAVAELQTLADNGFTAVGAITGDPVLGTLSGDPAFDAFVETLSVKAYPCDNQDKFRQFDFWIGDWEVRTADGTMAGRNSIEARERGCVLLESWTGASGDTGMSINYLDHDTGEWVQVWNSAGGVQIDIRGGMTEEGMLLTGQIHYVGNGTTAPFRGLWTPLPDGRVRQFFEQSNDSGKTWVPWFEGFYASSDQTD